MRNFFNSLGLLGFSFFLIFTLSFYHAESRQIVKKETNVSLQYELDNAIYKGLEWLKTKQKADGSWSQPEHPALTALVLSAFLGEPSGKYRAKKPEFVLNAYKYLLSNVQPDGGIYSKTPPRSLENYNTAISLMALLAAEDKSYEPVIIRARNYLVSLQNEGGIGYAKSGHADMPNTFVSLEALYYSKYLAEDNSDSEVKRLAWDRAIRFVQRCQNLPKYNPASWASDDPANKGGFIYYPGQSKAGEMKLPSGKTALRSYGSISYAGLLSYLYADLKKDDPRVLAVYRWLQENYSLDENPGMGPQGLFFYYHTMAKALAAYGEDQLTLRDSTSVNWRKALAERLLSLQNGEHGYWVNENGRWWEKDSVLVTSYSLLSLEIIHRGL